MTRATKAQWAERVRRWKASGQTAREFGARGGFNPSTLRWWGSQLRAELVRRPAFVEVQLAAPSSIPAGTIELVLPGEVRLRVTGVVAPAALRNVLEALGVR